MRVLGTKEMMWIALAVSILIGIWFFDKLNLDWMLLLYGLGVIIVGVVIFMGDWEPSHIIKGKDKKLGPSYWGVYSGTAMTDSPEECGIVPPEPCKEMEVMVGSGMYSKGAPVKSAK